MRTIALPVLSTLLGLIQSRALLHLEILALRQQLAMVNQIPRKRLRFHWDQRLFWVWLYRLWPGCLQVLQVFKPDTLVRWHRKGFRLYWTWKSRCRTGGRKLSLDHHTHSTNLYFFNYLYGLLILISMAFLFHAVFL